MFFRVKGGSVAEKSWLSHATVPGVAALPWNLATTARAVVAGDFFLFFVDAVLLCFACVETLCALELVHQSDVFFSSMLQLYCVVQFSLCRSQWNGCIKASRRVLVRKAGKSKEMVEDRCVQEMYVERCVKEFRVKVLLVKEIV